MSTDRLDDLRGAAGLGAGAGPASGKEESQALLLQKDKEFKEIYMQEAVARSSLTKVTERVQGLHRMMRELRKVMLPGGAQKLTYRMIGEEQACLKLIKRTHELVVAVQGHDASGAGGQEEQEDDFGQGKQSGMSDVDLKTQTLQRIRHNFSTHLTLQLAKVSEDLVEFKTQRRMEGVDRIRRHLEFAFPDATEVDINLAMDMPEIAQEAIKRRLEASDNCPRLDILTNDLQSSKLGMQKRLEAEARDLELLFFRFNELVQSNDEKLSEIENNISSTLDQTTEAVKNLEEAKALQKGNNRRKMFMQCCCLVVMFYMMYSFLAPMIRMISGSKPAEPEKPKEGGEGGGQDAAALLQVSLPVSVSVGNLSARTEEVTLGGHSFYEQPVLHGPAAPSAEQSASLVSLANRTSDAEVSQLKSRVRRRHRHVLSSMQQQRSEASSGRGNASSEQDASLRSQSDERIGQTV
eukprot:TRINITY_DN59673_c0_g1_i1.p1 TRINITY_DN59673_c0_g1~~TRINITY_DN59673_c0_g1_i1.p1  ORF type:complete len:465 (-),score=160.46 TRINITY_DN59673_c0_g1_i1:19-1413(-)